MASMNLDEKDSVHSVHIEKLLKSDGACESDACDDAILPRVGNKCQVEIPSLVERSEYLSLSWDPIDAENQAYYLGLEVELTWIDLNHPIPSKSPIKKEACSNDNDNSSDEDKYLVPMSLPSLKWTEDEKASFVLGLYIFRKNFVAVKKIVQTREMGELLLFYYGEFYGSDEYRKWSDWRQKTKKSNGQRIFAGSRHQELMSRLLPTLSEDNHNALSKVSKNFSDEKMSLVDYVSSLKSIVGINALVEAIGIGKGKLDLTTMAMKPSKSNSQCPKIPTGKACSSLTTSEIIKILSGDYRLSKARSNDLFWEAIWPRLLARGWHSEQPREVCLKVCLVFLVPGVNKFSRRKLVKGEHYYDSVTDVLRKVAKEPEIIELDNDVEINDKNKEDNDEKHCYLGPRTPNRSADVMVFTVVDTSLSGGKIRALRSLPTDESETTKRKSEEIEKNSCQGKNKKQKKVVKSNLKRENGEHIAPLKKRCKKETGKSGLAPRMENEISSCFSRTHELPKESSACDPEMRALVDLNIHQVSPELENGFFVTTTKQEKNPRSEPETGNLRRQSKRYRPPTMRALEAVAYGYF